MEAAQQAGGGAAAVAGAGAQVGERVEVRGERLLRERERRLVPRPALERGLGAQRAPRGGCHSAEGDARRAHHAVLEVQREGATHCRDVRVEALRQFPAPDLQPGGGQWHLDRGDDLVGGEVLLHVVEVEVLEGHATLAVRAGEHDPAAERDQRRHRVADWRAVGDVAAQGAGVAHRRRGEALPQLAQFGEGAGERSEGVGEADRGADVQRAVFLPHAAQLGDLAEIKDGAERAESFVDPHADVGAAGQQRRLGMALAQFEQLGERARGEEAFAVVRVVQGGGALQREQLFAQHVAVERQRGAVEHALAGLDDRAVAGAAAQVAGERAADTGRVRPAVLRLAGVVEIPQRHRKAWRAEAALRAVAVDQRLLHRMQRTTGLAAQVFDGEHGLAVERGDEAQAGVDGGQMQRRAFAAQFARHHGARAAVALVAAFLGAGEAARAAQPGEQAGGGGDVSDVDRLAVEQDADGGAIHRRVSGAGAGPTMVARYARGVPRACGHAEMR